ncbi:MAG: DUF6894 family protein [Sphingomonas sp.]
MALYYFHLRDGVDVLLDPEGRELDSGNIAEAALTEARAIISADARNGHVFLDQNIDVQDASGAIVHCIAFEDAVQVTHSAVKSKRTG